MDPVCSLFREDDHFRRFFAMFSWFLKIFTVIVFLGTFRLFEQHVGGQGDQEAHDEHIAIADAAQRARRGGNYPRRRRVGYRQRVAPAA